MPSSRKNILIVEDDDDLRSIFSSVLKFAGFDVTETADGPDALRIVEVRPPDLVVLDIRLPSLDGFSVRDELAADPRTKNIPVVIVTGVPAVDLSKLHGARLLHKPVPPEDLIATVRACLATAIGRRYGIGGAEPV